MSESADIDLEIDELQATFEDTVGRLFRGEIERDDFNIKHEYDLFLSHASEDKDGIARPLYEALIAAGISVWFDEAVLELGDSLRRKIDEGLAKCRYGLVILSPKFLSKQWPQRELDGLVARETASGEKAILPIWHELDQVALLRYFPPLVDRLAGRSEEGIPALVEKILRVLKK
jgi:TIR domain